MLTGLLHLGVSWASPRVPLQASSSSVIKPSQWVRERERERCLWDVPRQLGGARLVAGDEPGVGGRHDRARMQQVAGSALLLPCWEPAAETSLLHLSGRGP